MIKKRESVHRLLDVKGGTHFPMFPVFLGWSAGWTQLYQSSMCNRASVHRVQVWATTQSLNYEGHPSDINLGFKRFKNDHLQELNSSGVGHYINSEQRWINHEANEAWSSRSLLAPAAAAKSLQSCPTLCDPIDSSPLGSSVPGILQARILEFVTPNVF